MNMRGNQLDVLDIALKILNEGTAQDLEIFLVTSWTIWYCRNKNVFENLSYSDEQIWFYANTMRWEFKEATAVYCQSQNNEATRWEVPPLGWVKINVDGATSNDGRPSSVGVIIRDSKGETVAALCEVLQGQYLSLETEIVALEKGILLAKEMALTQVIFESDALTVIQEILSKESNGSLGHLYQGIEDLLKFFSCWKLCHLRREHNRVAHELAHHARSSAASQGWKGCSPPMV